MTSGFNSLFLSERRERASVTSLIRMPGPPNSPDLNPIDYHVWGFMLEKYKCLNRQPKNISELKTALLKIWDELAQDAVKSIMHQLLQASPRTYEWWQ